MKNELVEVAIPVLSGVVATIEAYYDSKKKNPEHMLSASVRLVVISTLCVYLYGVSRYATTWTVFSLTIYWAVFDIAYNYFKDISLWYIGGTAYLDRKAKSIFKSGMSYLFAKGWLLFFVFMIHKII